MKADIGFLERLRQEAPAIVESTTSAEDALSEVVQRARMTSGAELAGKQVSPGRYVEQRLRKKFGLGDQPAKRIALYRQLERIVEDHGEPAERVISEAVAESVSADRPDRYFCAAVKRKLQDRGFTRLAGASAQW